MADGLIKAQLRYARISPRKLKLVADLVRGKNVDVAMRLLTFTPKKGAELIRGLLRSALANAQQKGVTQLDRLFVHTIYVNQGPALKRIMPRAQGRAYLIRHRTSHVFLALKER